MASDQLASRSMESMESAEAAVETAAATATGGDAEHNDGHQNETEGYFEQLMQELDRHASVAALVAWVTLAFAVFGVASNVCSIAIYGHRSMRKAPINVLLVGLCTVDLLLSMMVVPLFVVPVLNMNYGWRLMDTIRPYVVLVVYPLTLSMHTASVWLFVAISFERWMAVCRPLQARRFSSVRNAKLTLAAVGLCAMLYNLVRFAEFRLVDTHGPLELEGQLRDDKNYMFVYYFGMYLLSHFVVPFTVLVIVNAMIVCAISRARAERRQLSIREAREHRTALMMASVVVAFLFCHTLPFAMNLLEACDRERFRHLETLYATRLLDDFANLLVVVSSSTTGIVYYSFSQKYRRCFRLFCRPRPREQFVHRLIRLTPFVRRRSSETRRKCSTRSFGLYGAL